jgi:hypothetical protein
MLPAAEAAASRGLLSSPCCYCWLPTDTRSNIKILADAFASEEPTNPVYVRSGKENARFNSKTNTDVCYFNGVGTAGAEGATKDGRNRVAMCAHVSGVLLAVADLW